MHYPISEQYQSWGSLGHVLGGKSLVATEWKKATYPIYYVLRFDTVTRFKKVGDRAALKGALSLAEGIATASDCCGGNTAPCRICLALRNYHTSDLSCGNTKPLYIRHFPKKNMPWPLHQNLRRIKHVKTIYVEQVTLTHTVVKLSHDNFNNVAWESCGLSTNVLF